MSAIKKNWIGAIAALTLVLGVIFAVNAFEKKVEKVQTMKKWGYNPNAPSGAQWTEVTGMTEQHPGQPGDYSCSSGEEICTADFDSTVDPNSSSTALPTNIVRGSFELVEN